MSWSPSGLRRYSTRCPSGPGDQSGPVQDPGVLADRAGAGVQPVSQLSGVRRFLDQSEDAGAGAADQVGQR